VESRRMYKYDQTHYFRHRTKGLFPRIIGRMLIRPLHQRMIRIVGLSTWLVTSIPTMWDVCNRPPYTPAIKSAFWLISFLVFGVSFWLSSVASNDLETSYPPNWRRLLALLLVQAAATLTMAYLVPCYSIGILLVPVAWQVALLFPLRIALAWILTQTCLLAAILYAEKAPGLAMFATSTSLGFQLFAFITTVVAKSESLARGELARANAELQATRELLAESSRISERARISGELHDVLGHNLTALNIHLEVAKHMTNGKALEHVSKSQSLAKILLQDVREVVDAVRGDADIDVRRAVEALVDGLPYPSIHLEMPKDLRIEDSLRAHMLLRCIQEIVTNTLRHSGAKNLWFELVKTDDGIEVLATDDGRGTKALRPGNGLTGMRQRLEEVGGRLRISSTPQQGFAVRAWVPSKGAIS
jgi:signal transduction histidine kinase